MPGGYTLPLHMPMPGAGFQFGSVMLVRFLLLTGAGSALSKKISSSHRRWFGTVKTSSRHWFIRHCQKLPGGSGLTVVFSVLRSCRYRDLYVAVLLLCSILYLLTVVVLSLSFNFACQAVLLVMGFVDARFDRVELLVLPTKRENS